MTLLLQYRYDALDAAVVLDDDGRTAYAYLELDGATVADVWLYNVVEAARTPEWQEAGAREKMPFANPAGFARAEPFEPISDPDDIHLDWQAGPEGLQQVTIFLRGERHAVLRPGAKPGWCRLAARPGPLAKPLHEAG